MPLLSLLACGGDVPPPAPPPAPVAKAAPPPAPDLSPVAEPASLVVVARVARPGQTVAAVAALMGKPPPPGAAYGQAFADDDIGDVLDLAQPVDVAVSVGGSRQPDVTWAASAALKGEAAVAALRGRYDVGTSLGGVTELKPKRDAEDETDRRCSVFPAAGTASLRLVCGGSARDVRELGPYLVRTRARAPIGKDLEIEGRGAPVRELLTRYKGMIPMFAGGIIGRFTGGVTGLSSLIGDAVRDIVDFGIDLDKVNLDVAMADAGVDLTFRVGLVTSTSTLGRMMTSNPEKAGPAPEVFAKLPADAESAFYGRGWDVKDLARPKEMVFQFARSYLAKEGITAVDSQAMEHAVSSTLDTLGANWVSASGTDWPAATAAVKKLEEARNAHKPDAILQAETAAVEKLDGWSVWATDLPADKVTGPFAEIAAVVGRPSVQKAIKAQLREGLPAPTVKFAPAPATAKLPKGAMHLTLTVTRLVDEHALESGEPTPRRFQDEPKSPASKAPAGKAPAPKAKPKLAKPITYHMYIASDGTRTWVASGFDEALILGKLRGVLAGTEVPLGGRMGLDRIKAGPFSTGGFLDARSLLRPESRFLPIFHSAGDFQAPSSDKLPTGDWGKTPITLTTRTEAGDDKRSLTLTLAIPTAAMKDLTSGALPTKRRSLLSH